MNVGTVTTAITEVQTVGDSILKEIEGLDPAVDAPAGVAEDVLDLLSQLVTAALTAWSNASGTPITPASVLALLPDQDPLPTPTP